MFHDAFVLRTICFTLFCEQTCTCLDNWVPFLNSMHKTRLEIKHHLVNSSVLALVFWMVSSFFKFPLKKNILGRNVSYSSLKKRSRLLPLGIVGVKNKFGFVCSVIYSSYSSRCYWIIDQWTMLNSVEFVMIANNLLKLVWRGLHCPKCDLSKVISTHLPPILSSLCSKMIFLL